MTLSAFRDFLFGPLRPLLVCANSATITPSEMLSLSLRQCQSPVSYFSALSVLNRQGAIALSVDMQRFVAEMRHLHDSEVLSTGACWALPLPTLSANDEFYAQLFLNFSKGYHALLSKKIGKAASPELVHLYLYEFYDEANCLFEALNRDKSEQNLPFASLSIYVLVNLYNEVTRVHNPANMRYVECFRTTEMLIGAISPDLCTQHRGFDMLIPNLKDYLASCSATAACSSENEKDEYVGVSKALRVLGISRTTLYNYIKSGKLPKYDRNGKPHFKTSDIQKLKETNPV